MRRLGGILWGCALLCAACTSETYDTGDGSYSYIRADFVMAHTAGAAEIDRVVTDEEATLTLAPHATAQWSSQADTLYRALLYYDYHEGAQQVRPRSLSQVLVLRPMQTTRRDTLKRDPMVFESAWMSKNGKFLNVGFAVKTGQDGDGQLHKQRLGLLCDTIREDGAVSALHFRITHDQCGVPEYYSSRGFLSIPINDTARKAAIRLQLTTYDGEVTKDF